MMPSVADILDSEEEEEEKKTPEDRKRHFRKELSAMLYGYGDQKVRTSHFYITLRNVIYDQTIYLFSTTVILGSRRRNSQMFGEYCVRIHRKALSEGVDCGKSKSTGLGRHLLSD